MAVTRDSHFFCVIPFVKYNSLITSIPTMKLSE
jgi:hypothetical protein